MNKEAVQELMMGAALVMLAYAAYRHFKPAAPRTAANKMAPTPVQGVAIGEPAPEYTGSPFTRLEDLLTGAVHDIGSFGGRNYLDEIADPLISGANETQDGPFVPGQVRYW